MEFKVQTEFEVLQSPRNLPPVFNGEKMVVYGVLKQKGALGQGTQVNCSAILKGSILGKVVEHSISFTCLCTAPMEKASALPSIHHLAGKALISDWQDEGRNNEEIVKLSVDSSVISSHTAFIAVDEESTEPISGAMKTWDIQADVEVEENMTLFSAQLMSTERQLNCVSALRAEPRKKGGGFLSSIGSAVSGLFSRSKTYKAEESTQDARVVVRHYSVLKESEEEEEYDRSTLSELEYDTPRGLFEGSEFIPAKRAVTPPSPQLIPSTVDLSSFITVQQADGSWKLDTSLAQLLGKSQKDLEEACPTECKGTMVMVWATVLVLSLLRSKYSSQQEEWDLIAVKAETWLKRQTLPPGVSLKDLYKAAE